MANMETSNALLLVSKRANEEIPRIGQSKGEQEDRMERETVEGALSALLKYLEGVKEKASKKALFDVPDPVHVQISLIGARKDRTPPAGIEIPLPHAYRETDAVSKCVIVRRPHKNYKKNLKEAGATKVIGLDQFKGKFKTYEAKRKLLRSYDMFFADTATLRALGTAMGRTFWDSNKVPIPLDISSTELAKEGMESAVASTRFHVRGELTTLVIGHTDMTPSQLADNVHEATAMAVSRLPHGWEDVLRVGVKTVTSPSLVVFAQVPSLPVLKRFKEEAVEGANKESTPITIPSKKELDME